MNDQEFGTLHALYLASPVLVLDDAGGGLTSAVEKGWATWADDYASITEAGQQAYRLETESRANEAVFGPVSRALFMGCSDVAPEVVEIFEAGGAPAEVGEEPTTVRGFLKVLADEYPVPPAHVLEVRRYLGVAHQDHGSNALGLSFLDFPGCVTSCSEGCLHELRKEGVKALTLHICGMEEDGEPIPPASSISAVYDAAFTGEHAMEVVALVPIFVTVKQPM